MRPGAGGHDRRRPQRRPAQHVPRHPRAPAQARGAGARRGQGHAGRQVGVLVDLQGPKIRIGRFARAASSWPWATSFAIDPTARWTPATRPASAPPMPKLVDDLCPRRQLLLDDGAIELLVTGSPGAHRLQGAGRRQAVEQQGHQQEGRRPVGAGADRQGQGRHPFAAEIEADYLAVSFVATATTCKLARSCSGGRRQGRHRRQDRARRGPGALEDIIDASDAIMVARGDLGVEIGDAELPAVQKRLISDGPRAQQRRHHRDADDAVDDREPDPDPRRGLRRRQRRARRHRRGDAVGREFGRQEPGQGGRGLDRICAEAEKLRNAAPATASTRVFGASTRPSPWPRCTPPITWA
jgi:hypothetical protein